MEKILYLTSSRPDIAFSVQHLSQFLHAPRAKHLEAVHRVLRYLQLTKAHGIFFPSQIQLVIKGYSDNDWGGCALTRRSVGGYAFLLGSAVVSWRSKKQQVLSKSSAEAEYRALSDVSCEAVWLTSLFKEPGLSSSAPIPLLCDNKAAVDLSANPVYHARTKHIEIDCHFIREKITSGLISVFQVLSKDNAANILTKGLGKALHWNCSSKLALLTLLCLQFVGGIL